MFLMPIRSVCICSRLANHAAHLRSARHDLRRDNRRDNYPALATRRFAAFFMEPIQSEGGVRVPSRDYVQAAQRLCRKNGTLFVLDEVQTGMYRTGPFLAACHRALGVRTAVVRTLRFTSGNLHRRLSIAKVTQTQT